MTVPGFTILGSRGFIGSQLVRHLHSAGVACETPARGDDLRGRSLGHLIYCAGLTADFRTRPLDAVEAHVTTLANLVRDAEFEALVYLSSTRVYKRHAQGPAREDGLLLVDPQVFDDLYGLSKLMGEAIAGTCGARAHIVRLSNVYGGAFDQPGFLNEVLKAALTCRHITLRTSPESSRDYVAVADVVAAIDRIARDGTEPLYNVASGENVSNGALVEAVRHLTGCRVTVAADAPTVRFPEIDIHRMRTEFGVSPRRLLDELPGLTAACTAYWSDRGLD